MTAVSTFEFTWQESDPSHPAQDVLVRLIGFDNVYDTRELGPYLLKRADASGQWTGTVELPDEVRTSYQFCPARDFRIPPSGLDEDGWMKVIATGVPDPAVPNTIGPVYGNSRAASILEMPGASPQPWWEHRAGVAQGTVQELVTGRDWPSSLHVYSPPVAPGGPLPVVVMFDAQAWVPIGITATFDNLIAEELVPPFVAAMAGYPFGPARVRGLTYPAVHLQYLMEDLMPLLVKDFGGTTEASRTVLIGQSLGGLAAVSIALKAPHRFGNVLSQSASVWWPGTEEGQLSGDGVIAEAAAGHKQVRFWLEAGALEDGLVEGNRDLHKVLGQHGFDVTYREYQGGHDFACWRGGIADGLIALLNR